MKPLSSRLPECVTTMTPSWIGEGKGSFRDTAGCALIKNDYPWDREPHKSESILAEGEDTSLCRTLCRRLRHGTGGFFFFCFVPPDPIVLLQ